MTRLFGAVQPVWICSHKCAVDVHLKHARTRERSHKPAPNTTQGCSQFTSSSRPNLKAWSDNRISDDILLGSNLERDTLLSTRQLGDAREVWESIHLKEHTTYRWSHAYPLLVMMAYALSSDHRSGVGAATHSSRSSNKGWWLCCSTVAMMGIREPRGKVVDSAGPEKSSMGEETSWLEVHSLPNVKPSVTMHILQLGSPIRDHCSNPYMVHIFLHHLQSLLAQLLPFKQENNWIALTICNSYMEDQIR